MRTTLLDLAVESRSGTETLAFQARHVVLCGWVGRDHAALQSHIEELARIGVPRPTQVPIYIRLPSSLLSTVDEIEVGSTTTSGEVECVLLSDGPRRWLTVGSDHTDRNVETFSIVASKQMCGKYLAGACWPFEEVEPHCDELRLRSWVTCEGRKMLYQDAPLASLLSPPVLLQGALADAPELADGLALFGGTVATTSALVYGDRYDVELYDPVLDRAIRGGYRVSALRQRL